MRSKSPVCGTSVDARTSNVVLPVTPAFAAFLLRAGDSGRVVVEPEEPRVRERRRHRADRLPAPAAHVRDLRAALQLLLHAADRRDPLVDQEVRVPRLEEPLGPHERVVGELCVRHAAAFAERPHDAGDHLVVVREHLRESTHEHRAQIVRQHRGLRRRQVEGPRGGVVVKVAGRRHRGAPLAQVALLQTRLRRQLIDGDRARLRQRLEDAELVANVDVRRRHRRSKLAHHLVGEIHHLVHARRLWCDRRRLSDSHVWSPCTRARSSCPSDPCIFAVRRCDSFVENT